MPSPPRFSGRTGALDPLPLQIMRYGSADEVPRPRIPHLDIRAGNHGVRIKKLDALVVTISRGTVHHTCLHNLFSIIIEACKCFDHPQRIMRIDV